MTAHQFLPKHSSGTEILTRDTGLEMLGAGMRSTCLTADPDAPGNAIERFAIEDYAHRGSPGTTRLGAPEAPVGSLEDTIRDEYDNGLVADHVRSVRATVIKPDAVHIVQPLAALRGP